MSTSPLPGQLVSLEVDLSPYWVHMTSLKAPLGGGEEAGAADEPRSREVTATASLERKLPPGLPSDFLPWLGQDRMWEVCGDGGMTRS